MHPPHGGLLRMPAPPQRGAPTLPPRRRPARPPSPLGPLANSRIVALLQAARAKVLQAAYRQAEAKKLRENPPTAGQIRNLGLLDKEEDTKTVLGSS